MEITRPKTGKIEPREGLVLGQPAASDARTAEPFHRGRGRMRAIKNIVARRVLSVAAVLLILLLISIGVVLVTEAMPILRTFTLVELLTSNEWSPSYGKFGLRPFIVGSGSV